MPTQLGLFQEGILFGRLKEPIRSYLTPGQSGYVRDVSDAHLLLHELQASVIGSGRCLWMTLYRGP